MEYKILEEMFKGENPKNVFEVGCANGGLLKDLGIKIVGGIDRHAGDIEKSKKLFPDGEFLLQNIEDIPWTDKHYEIIFSVGTLMYIEKIEFVLKEMFRIGDKIIIAEPTKGEITADHHGSRFYHNYEALGFNAVGTLGDKTIFKCK